MTRMTFFQTFGLREDKEMETVEKNIRLEEKKAIFVVGLKK